MNQEDDGGGRASVQGKTSDEVSFTSIRLPVTPPLQASTQPLGSFVRGAFWLPDPQTTRQGALTHRLSLLSNPFPCTEEPHLLGELTPICAQHFNISNQIWVALHVLGQISLYASSWWPKRGAQQAVRCLCLWAGCSELCSQLTAGSAPPAAAKVRAAEKSRVQMEQTPPIRAPVCPTKVGQLQPLLLTPM